MNPRLFTIQEDRDNFDYIHSSRELARLDGRKYRKKRKLAQRFAGHYPQFVFKELDLTNSTDQGTITDLLRTWQVKKKKLSPEVRNENQAIRRACVYAKTYTLHSFGVFLDDILAGFTINEVAHDGFYVGHFGKADPDFEGLSEFLESQTAKKMVAEGCISMNYQQDLGIEGLRLSKSSWRPTGYSKNIRSPLRENEALGSMRILLAVVIIVGCSTKGNAQSSVFFVPSTDIQEKKSLYLNLEAYAHFDRYEKGGCQTYGPTIVYGLGKNVEAGLNYYFTDDEAGNSHEIQPNIKWRVYNNEKKGIALAVGSILFVPLNHSEGRTSAMFYVNASKTLKSAKDLRLTGGIYRQVNGGSDFGTKTGALVGLEQPITKRLTLLADWSSGNNRLGYSNIGFGYGIKKSQYLAVGYTFGNSGRGNNFLSVFYGFNFD